MIFVAKEGTYATGERGLVRYVPNLAEAIRVLGAAFGEAEGAVRERPVLALKHYDITARIVCRCREESRHRKGRVCI